MQFPTRRVAVLGGRRPSKSIMQDLGQGERRAEPIGLP